RGKVGQSSNVPAGSRKAGHDSTSNRSNLLRHHNRDSLRRFLGSTGVWRTSRNDYVYLETHQLGRQLRQPIEFSLRPPILNYNVFLLQVSKLPQALSECVDSSRVRGRGATNKESYPGNLRWVLRRCRRIKRKQHGAKRQSENPLIHLSLLAPYASPLP